MKAIKRCCCPCCLRGEPDDKRVKVAYGNASPSKPQAEESVALLKPEEQPQDALHENGETVKENGEGTPDQDHNDNKDDDGGDKDGEAVEYTDENGEKTVTTTTTKTASGGDESPKNLTREISEKTIEKPQPNIDENTEVIEYVDKYGRRVRRIVKKKIITTVSTKRGSVGNGSTENRKITSGRNGTGIPPRAAQEKDVFLHFDTTSSGHDGEHPIVVVKKDGRQIDMPDWMEERKSPATQRKHVENTDITIHLKYPGDYTPGKKEPEEQANESKIQPEVAKPDKPDISSLRLEDVATEKDKEKEDGNDDEDEDDEDDDDDEYDEFEEEIVLMEVSRQLRFPKGLDIPNPEPEKEGVPIEDLLEVPTLQVEQESAPNNELFVEEKIESVERPPVVHCELLDLNLLEEQ